MASPMIRKALVIIPLIMLSFGNGLLFGHMTGMVVALRNKDDGISLTDNEISIITSIINIMSSIGTVSVVAVSDKIERRCSVMLYAPMMILSWITLYSAKHMYMFLLSRCLGGISFGGILTLCVVTTTEYISPNTRAFYLHSVITVAPGIGVGLGHVLGTILHWRTGALISIIPALFGIIVPYFWVESPHWLASKGRFDECEKAFWKLHNNNTNSRAELQWLIKVEKSKLEKVNSTNSRSTLKRFFLAFRQKYLWKLALLCFFMDIFIVASGKLLFTVYATVILEEITGTSDILLYTLMVDAFFIVGSCMSLMLVRNMSIRNLIFVTGFLAISILVVLCLCLFFKIGKDMSWIYVTLIGAYFIILNSGPIPSLEALIGEIFPLEFKIYCMFLEGLSLGVLYWISIYAFPYVVSAIGYYNFYLLQSILMTSTLVFLWFWLPETKGRTLQQIEVYFKTNIFDVDEALSNEELKVFI